MSHRAVTERFSDRVDNYVRYRPDYPAEALEHLRECAGLMPEHVVADLGSGTGILTGQLLHLGCTVWAVEPNGPMREAAERRLGLHSGFRSIAGTAEHTTLPDSSVEGVTAAQAFHWFDPGAARAEFQRILKPRGWVALLWNTRKIDATPFLREYEALLKQHGTDYENVDHRQVNESVLSGFFGGPFERRLFPHSQEFDYAGLEGRLMSCSYVPPAGDPAHAPMLSALRELYERHALQDRVRFLYDTEVHFGRLG